ILKLLVVNDFTYIGGAEQVVLNFCQYICKNKTDYSWIIHTLTSAAGSFSRAMESFCGKRVHFIDLSDLKRNWKSPVAWHKTRQKLNELFKEVEPDIILCNSFWAAIAVRGQAQGRDIPVICAIHADIQPKRRDKQIIFQLAGSVMSRGIDGWLTVSDRLAEQLSRLNIPSEIIRVVPNGVYLPADADIHIEGPWRKKLNIPGDAVLVASLGRLHPRKGQHLVIDAMVELADKYPKVFLVIAGEENDPSDESLNYTELLKNKIKEFKLENRVFLTGFVRNAMKILLETDIVVSASAEESFGLAILEGMAAGCAVVATDVYGHAGLISDEKDGFLVPLNNAGAMTKALQNLVADKKLRCRMGAAARQKASKYDIQTTMSQWTDFVRRIVDTRQNCAGESVDYWGLCFENSSGLSPYNARDVWSWHLHSATCQGTYSLV
ncbi:glycosyltransferase family 4 protein, partial [bacterium]|nr:glycosyltransferase family 4 protein [bacterium]